MKSSLLFAAIVAVSITSCQSTDEPVTNQPLPQKMRFIPPFTLLRKLKRQ